MPNLADGQAVVIRELEGDLREVELGDSDLPERGVEVGGKMRTVPTWYPGAKAASTQVMGTEDEPIVLKGFFNDRWTGLIDGAAAKRAALESLRLGQRYCELQWGSLITVRGFLVKTRFKILREHQIAYELEFQVAETDLAEVIATPAVVEGQADPLTVLDLLSDALDALEDAALVSNAVQAII